MTKPKDLNKETDTKSRNFFLIHNYNTVPEELVSLCEDYRIIDASDDAQVTEQLLDGDYSFEHVENTGHNLTSYFSYFADHHEELPDVMCLCKGNMIGRHVSREYFERAMSNTWFTYLYEEKAMRARYSRPTKEMLKENGGKDIGEGSIACLLSECQYTEENSSWYMQTGTHPYRYFRSYDELLTFVYRDPVLPRRISFAPGGCYIVRREMVTRHGAAFYRNLNKVMNYTLEPGFPAEAFIVERMMPLIFESNYEVNPWMEDEMLFDERLAHQEELITRERAEAAGGKNVIGKLKRIWRGL